MKKSNNSNRKTMKRKIKGGKTIKKMNCSPMVDNKTPVKGSCFTPDVLQLLKKSYNKYIRARIEFEPNSFAHVHTLAKKAKRVVIQIKYLKV